MIGLLRKRLDVPLLGPVENEVDRVVDVDRVGEVVRQLAHFAERDVRRVLLNRLLRLRRQRVVRVLYPHEDHTARAFSIPASSARHVWRGADDEAGEEVLVFRRDEARHRAARAEAVEDHPLRVRLVRRDGVIRDVDDVLLGRARVVAVPRPGLLRPAVGDPHIAAVLRNALPELQHRFRVAAMAVKRQDNSGGDAGFEGFRHVDFAECPGFERDDVEFALFLDGFRLWSLGDGGKGEQEAGEKQEWAHVGLRWRG
ncbi:MAG: hypothetical protein FD180_132 [Planctomycetota bacterium]|nr:MAG: hypothetical protein FD180_132 [Planctomycetota bacterium]